MCNFSFFCKGVLNALVEIDIPEHVSQLFFLTCKVGDMITDMGADSQRMHTTEGSVWEIV